MGGGGHERTGSLLHAHELPSEGGDTLFANMFPSRRGLVPAVRAFIDFLGTELSETTARSNRNFAAFRERGRQP